MTIKKVILSVTRDEGNALCFQDFKKISDYNSAIAEIVLQLKIL